MRRPVRSAAPVLVLVAVLALVVAVIGFVAGGGGDDRGGPGDPRQDGAPAGGGDAPRDGGTAGEDRAARPRAAAPLAAEDDAADLSIRGTVTRTDPRAPNANAPAAGAVVALLRPAPRGAPGVPTTPAEVEVAATTADAGGRWEVVAPGPGEWIVIPRAEGATGIPVRTRTGSTGVDLRLEPVLRDVLVRVRARPRGDPVAGAAVVVGSFDVEPGPRPVTEFVPRARTATDESGAVRIGVGPADGIVVVAAGFATRAVTKVGDGEEHVWLDPGDRIEGVVRDESGAPVAGARIRLADEDVPCVWRSASDGRFALDGIEAPGPNLEAEADGATWQGAIPVGTTDAVVVLRRRESAVTGVVLDPDGAPVAGAELSWGGPSGNDGRFEIARVPAGRLVLGATWRRDHARDSLPDLSGSTVVDVPRTGRLDGVTIRLAPVPRSWAVFRFVDAEGNAVRGAKWSIAGVPVERREDAAVVAVASAPGDTIRVWFQGFVGARRLYPAADFAVVTSASPDADPTVLRLPALGEITAEVVFPDRPGPPVADYRFGTRPTLDRTEVGLCDQYSFVVVSPETVAAASITWRYELSAPLLLVARAPGYAEVRRFLAPGEVASGRVVLRMERGSRVTGRLVSADPLAPESATVRLVREGGAPGAWLTLDVHRDDEGRFAAANVGTGRWKLVVDWPSPMTAYEREIDVAGDVDVGDVTIPVPGRLRGAALLPDGRPAGGASVAFHVRRADDTESVAETFVRSDGTFALDVAAGARGAVLVSREGAGSAVVAADASSPGALRATLGREGRLEVRIRLPARRSAWSWAVCTPDGSVRWQPASEETLLPPGFDHVELFRGLAPGPIVAVAEGIGWKVEAPAVVVAGETTVVVLDGTR